MFSTYTKLTSKSLWNLFSSDSSPQLFNGDFFFLLLILHCNDLIFRFNLLHSLETDKFFIHSGFQGRISWCHFAETMVFSNGEKAVIKNDFLEIEWNAYKICKEHPTKSWNRVSVYILLKRFQEDNSMDRRAGSGRQRTITTEEKENLIENLICSQEENPGSRMSPREVERNPGKRIIKRRGLK